MYNRLVQAMKSKNVTTTQIANLLDAELPLQATRSMVLWNVVSRSVRPQK